MSGPELPMLVVQQSGSKSKKGGHIRDVVEIEGSEEESDSDMRVMKIFDCHAGKVRGLPSLQRV